MGTAGSECFEVTVEAKVAQLRLSRPKRMISYTRDHSVAERFAYLNALQPGIFSVDDIQRAIASARTGKTAEFEDLPPAASAS